MLRSVESGNRQNQQKSGTLPAASSLPGRHATLPEGKFVRLQTMHGNQGVQRLLRGGVLQRKLTINQPGDAFEQEADRVAEKVMRMPGPSATQEPVATSGMEARLQRCACGKSAGTGTQCEECKAQAMQLQRSPAASVGAANRPHDEFDQDANKMPGQRLVPQGGMSRDILQFQRSESPEKVYQRKQVNETGPAVPLGLETRINHLQGSGRPLPPRARSFFEPRFGSDFSDVRVHTDAQAAKTASSVQALAFTTGHDIVFAQGQYAPDTATGQKLLAHELTHVVQQTGSRTSAPIRRAADTHVQRLCGPTDIGNPAGCTPSTEDPVGDLILFRVNCDDFTTAAEQRKVEEFADSMTASDRVRIHGFASTDGDPTFNDHLSCARALRAFGVLAANRISPSNMEVFNHGATVGPAAQRRSVVLERVPGVSRPVVPQLTATVVTPPTGGICGGDTFVIRWRLSRNSSPAGGFVIQDVTFRWNVTDCTGASVPNPDPRTSPLHYFEAWQVPPASVSPNATAFTVDTDQFFWPGNAPWGGGCSDGTVSIQATARYHDGVAALPAHMSQFNGATFANDLFSSVTDPALGGGVSRPFTHSLRLHWNCCPCSSSPTSVDSHVP